MTYPKMRPSHATGRVTGFAPNGACRVHLENGQWRIWPAEKLVFADQQGCQQDQHVKMWRLRLDLIEWVERIGEDRARHICSLIWPSQFK